MQRRSFFWVGTAVLVAIVGLGITPAQAQTRSKAKPKPRPKTTLVKRASSARQRSIATTREMNNAVVPRYKVDASGDLVPDLRAAAAIIFDPDTNQILWEENGTDQRSIASITKVMTATVFLERNPDLTRQVTVVGSDVYRASTTKLRAGDKVRTGDLLHLLLIASDNAAARVLARVSDLGTQGFIARMNEKAVELGLTSTHYVDTSGLLSDNVSSAYDMARLITLASADERIGSVMRMPNYSFRTPRRTISMGTTNRLLTRPDVDVRAGKTGFITKSGYCLVTLLRLPETGRQVAVVVLGARSNAGRFLETENLFNWLSSKATTLFATQAPLVVQQQQQ